MISARSLGEVNIPGDYGEVCGGILIQQVLKRHRPEEVIAELKKIVPEYRGTDGERVDIRTGNGIELRKSK